MHATHTLNLWVWSVNSAYFGGVVLAHACRWVIYKN